MQKITVLVRFPSTASSFPWLREALDIIFLSKNLPRQDFRHCELDHDRRNNSVDDYHRVSLHLSLRYGFQSQLGHHSRQSRALR